MSAHDDDTCPHLVVLGRLEAENARLKAEVYRLEEIVGSDAIDRKYGMCCDASDEVSRLKAEAERLTLLQAETLSERNKAEAEVERLTKAVMHSPAAQPKLKELEGKTTYEEINPIAENARLKAEVERLDTLCKQVMSQHSDISCENIMLRKAGDAMAEVCENDWKNRIQGSIEYHLEAKPHKIPHEYFLVQRWNAAKEGKQP